MESAAAAWLRQAFGAQADDGLAALGQRAGKLYTGEDPRFEAPESPFHTLPERTRMLHALLLLLQNYRETEQSPELSLRQVRLAWAAAWWAGAGQLKARGDVFGSGAKYGLEAARRAGETAQSDLLALGWEGRDALAVRRLLAALAPESVPEAMPFPNPGERMVARLLLTAQLLSRWSRPDLAARLDDWFRDIREAYDHRRVPAERRRWNSRTAFIRSRRSEWNQTVLPRLEREGGGHFRLLSSRRRGPGAELWRALEQQVARLP